MIIVNNITKSYGNQVLFKDTGFKLNDRERLGLVGRNGHGKTTLFRLITGDEEVDSGVIVIPKGYSIGYVDQEPDFSEETVLGEGCRGLPPHERDQSWKIEKILFGLGFIAGDMKKHPSQLSGGFQVRLNLAKVLVRDNDLLLLDEPNNYLDITSIRWLTKFLNGWKGELILITHDRSFMDNVVTHTLGIYRKTFRKIRGDTGKLYGQIAMEEEVYERTRLKDERKRKHTEDFIRRFRAKARLVGLVQSRIRSLEKQQKLEKLEKAKDLEFSFVSSPFNGKPVMNVRDLSFGYDPSTTLFSDLSFTVGPYDRICVVGRNGKGKTTLMKTIAGKLQPLTGELSKNVTIETGYYEQANVDSLDGDRTVVDEIMSADPSVTQQIARSIAGQMMFEKDNALKRIRVLSGGEKSRVMLAKIIATPANLLLLDEPTNHLDMESCDALLEALNAFEGAVVMITHNEMLLHGLAERLIVFQEGEAKVYEGGYQEFLETKGWDDEQVEEPLKVEDSRSMKKSDRKEQKRLRARMQKRRTAELRPLEERIETLEGAIVRAEELDGLHKKIETASREGDSEAIAELSRNIYGRRHDIEELFEQLDTVNRNLHTKRILLDKEFGETDAEADR